MAVAARQYYYEEYRGTSARRTPPLNAADLRYAREYYTAAPIGNPVIMPDAPQSVPQPRRNPQRRRKENEVARRIHYPYISAKEKLFIFTIILVFSAILMGIILLSSYHAYMQNEVNVTKAKTASVQEDIDELRVAIEKNNNIDIIEQKAMSNLGMRYPKAKQIVYLDDVGEIENDEV
jgi:cell division protein FtsL